MLPIKYTNNTQRHTHNETWMVTGDHYIAYTFANLQFISKPFEWYAFSDCHLFDFCQCLLNLKAPSSRSLPIIFSTI